MHLSFLSGSYFSDSIRDGADPIVVSGLATAPDAHFQGLLRGLIFGAALAAPLALAVASAWLHRSDVVGALQAPAFLGGTATSSHD